MLLGSVSTQTQIRCFLTNISTPHEDRYGPTIPRTIEYDLGNLKEASP